MTKSALPIQTVFSQMHCSLVARRLAVVGLLVAAATFASAQTTWVGGTGPTGTNWDTLAHWQSSVPTATVLAQFDSSLGNNVVKQATANLGAAGATLGIRFLTGNKQSYTIQSTGGHSLTIHSSGIINYSDVAQSISAPLVLGAGQTWTNSPTSLTTTALTISGSVANGSNLLTLTGAGTAGLISGVIGNGSGGLTKTGTGTWTLQGANSYSGATTVSQGTLTVNGTSGKLGPGDLSVATGSTLNLNNTVIQSVGNLSGAGTINFGAAGTLSIAQASSTTFSGAITGSGATLAKSGGGSLTLSGSSSLANININNGSLIFANTASLPSASAVSLGGGTLQLGTTGTFSTSGALSLTASSTIDFATQLTATELAFGPSTSAWTGTLTILNYQTSQHTFRVGNSADDIGANWMSIQFILGGVPHLALTGADGLIVPGSAIPEPSTYAAIFGAVALGGAIYRRRRKAALASTSAPAAPQAA